MQERLLFGVIPVYGLLIAIAVALGVFLCSRQEKRLGLPQCARSAARRLPRLYDFQMRAELRLFRVFPLREAAAGKDG